MKKCYYLFLCSKCQHTSAQKQWHLVYTIDVRKITCKAPGYLLLVCARYLIPASTDIRPYKQLSSQIHSWILLYIHWICSGNKALNKNHMCSEGLHAWAYMSLKNIACVRLYKYINDIAMNECLHIANRMLHLGPTSSDYYHSMYGNQ